MGYRTVATGLRGAVLAYAAAFSLTHFAVQALVFQVARAATGGDPARLRDAERAFAQSAGGLMAGASIEGLVLLGVAVVAARLEGAAVAARLGLGPSRATSRGAAAAVLGLLGLNFACSAALELAGVSSEGVMDVLGRALRGTGPAGLLLGVVTIGIVPALGEEVLFRGLLQRRLAAHTGRWPAIVVTSAAFGVFHRDLLQGTVAFVAGLLLGWTADRLGGVRPVICAHAVNNAAFVVLASVGAAGAQPAGAALVSLSAGAAVLAAAAAVLGRAGSVES